MLKLINTIIKLTQFLIVFIIFAALFVIILITYPQKTLQVISNFTPYTITVDNVDINATSIIIDNISITHNRNIYNANELIVDINKFNEAFFKITSLDIFINDAVSQHERHDFDFAELPNIVIDDINIYYHDIVVNIDDVEINDSIVNATLTKMVYTEDILKYIPNKTVVNYLANSLQRTTLQNATITFDLKTFDINIVGVLTDTKLKPYKKWQTITAETIKFKIDNDKLILNIISGIMGGVALTEDSVIVDWGQSKSVQVNVSSDNQAKDLIVFLLDSPIKNKVNNIFAKIKVDGAVRSKIYLQFYFDKNKKAVIDIDMKLLDNQITMFDKMVISDFIGKLTFTDHLYIGGDATFKNYKFNVDLTYTDVLIAEIIRENILISIDNISDWFINIVSDNATGNVSLNLDKNIPKIIVSDLVINNIINNGKLNLTIDDFNDFDLITNNIKINNYVLPNITANIRKKSEQIDINNLAIDGLNVDNSQIIFNGNWNKDNIVNITTMIKGNKLSDLLKAFNIKQVIQADQFLLNLDLACNCAPWQLAPDKLFGSAKIKINDGLLKSQSNTFINLLSLLSIESLLEGLETQINDTLANDLAYNKINSSVNIGNGIIDINDFNLKSDIVNIEITGSTNFINKTHKLNAVVTPQVKNSIPFLTYITGGGLTGLSAWLIDKTIFDEGILGTINDELVNFNYKIRGFWDKPSISR